jgi:hypothetical protein
MNQINPVPFAGVRQILSTNLIYAVCIGGIVLSTVYIRVSRTVNEQVRLFVGQHAVDVVTIGYVES